MNKRKYSNTQGSNMSLLNTAESFRKGNSTFEFKTFMLLRTQATKINATIKLKRKKSNLMNKEKHSSTEVITKHAL